MAGVMVVYHPPITHLPPPAVGTSPDAAIHDFKGSCRRSVRMTGCESVTVCTAYALRYQIYAINTVYTTRFTALIADRHIVDSDHVLYTTSTNVINYIRAEKLES